MFEHFEALEASFQASYGLDLRRAVWGPDHIGVRRLGALVSGLPPRSALHRDLHPGGGADWGPVEEFTATLAELIDSGNRMFWKANFKGNPPGQAIEIERPPPPKGARKKQVAQVRIASREDLKAALEREGRLFKGARKVAAKLKGGDEGAG